MILKYEIRADSIAFWCTGIDGNSADAILLNDFILDMSREKNVFFHSYRLPNQDVPKMIEQSVILKKAEVLQDPFNTYFQLSEAKVKISCFYWACETNIYYFDNKIEWSDFLAAAPIKKPIELIQKGMLSAHFTTVDQGADYWFESNTSYEKKIMRLLESMSDLGYKIKQQARLTFPYS
jgi:hypothetical protein